MLHGNKGRDGEQGMAFPRAARLPGARGTWSGRSPPLAGCDLNWQL